MSMGVGSFCAAPLETALGTRRPSQTLDAIHFDKISRYGALLAIADPAEAEYPFEGRVRFSLPGAKTSRLIGRAENIRSDYLERFNQRRQDLSDIAAELGWRLITHKTNDAPSPVLAQLNALVLEAAN